MEGKKFSAAAASVIYVSDFLDRYDPDPLRYFLTAAGPETQDTDFTWAEFVRRNNDELVANWGNLVNRTLDESPTATSARCREPGRADASADQALLAAVEGGFATRRRAARRGALQAPRSARRCGCRRRSTST